MISSRQFILVVLTMVLLTALLGGADKTDLPGKPSDGHVLVPANLRDWSIAVTLRAGGGLEGRAFGAYRIEIQSDGSAEVVRHWPGRSRAEEIIFRGRISNEQSSAVFHAAADTMNGYELKPVREWGEDGWQVTLTVRMKRREASIAGRELAKLTDVGPDFPRLLEKINDFLVGDSRIRVDY